MMRRLPSFAWTAPLWCLTAGCFTDEQTRLVPDSPLGMRPPTTVVTRAPFAAASNEAAARVDRLGQTILAANLQTGIRPVFRTIGAPQPEIFHRGTSELFISEGLVKQCSTEGQLAAVLSLELGKMVSEREAQANPRSRLSNESPPPDAGVGDRDGSYTGPADYTRLAELAKYRTPTRREPPPAPPDPQVLARIYLQKAGFPPTDLDMAGPLLKQAAASVVLEKSINGTPPSPPMTPPPGVAPPP